MADGYFERGEVYGVRMDNGVGSEEGYYRPGVIVSSNSRNNTAPTVNVCYTTKTIRNCGVNFDTMATGVRSWVLCNQIATVDKRRLGTRMGALTADELQKLDSCLEKVLDLGYINDEEIDNLKTEVAILKAKLEATEEAKKDELLSLKVECEMWKKMYTKALDFVAEQNVAGAMAVVSKRSAPKPEPEPAVVAEPNVESGSPAIVESGLIDINHCTETELKKLGFSTPMARLIKSYRPFKDVPDLKRVPGMSKVKYQIIEKKVCCTPVVIAKPVVVKDEPDTGTNEMPKKVNVNTASGKEITEATGMPMADAYSISGYRNKNGVYTCLEDLLNVKRISSGKLEKYRSMLEV